jgi:ABC-type bacteriocin/lantibiotic exporter with double-glycine peptidase domain
VAAKGRTTPKLLAPEVVQTSAMDCGPATLKCLLDGFGLHASYGRLREACQTDVDGTSIDTLEDLANDIGLIAEQVLLPIDHVLSSAADVLPAIVVVRQPGGLLHFVVAWRRHGPVMQIMDPATGRRWSRLQTFADELYPHTMPVPAVAWRTWAESDLFRKGLRARASESAVSRGIMDEVIHEASQGQSWQPLAALDATVRMVSAVRKSGGFAGRDAERTLKKIWERTCSATEPTDIVPADYWTVRPGQPIEGDEHVVVRGAVLVRVRGVREAAERERREATLPRDIVAALHESSPGPGRHLLSLLAADGILAPATLLIALCLAAAGVVLEALLFRSVIDLGAHLSLSGQRLATMGAIVCLSGLLLALEVPIAGAALGLGRRLETRLRIAFLQKIPRLADRYFQSRPSSDMAERAHSAHQIRELPNMGALFVRSVFELLLTTVGIGLLFPRSALLAIAAAIVAVAIPAIAQPWLRERDLRQRTHTGALTRFFLDAFLGLVPVRAHAGERALAREQESLLVEWAQAGTAVLRAAVATSGAQLVIGFGLVAWLLFARAGLGEEGGGALLLTYWALNIPIIGQKIAQIAWQYPTERNLTLRLLEPLGALEDENRGEASPTRRRIDVAENGVSIRLEDVSVRAGGQTIVEEASLTIAPGAHVAIVGASGAGKSTLVGLLLGWHRPVSGTVIVDGERLEGSRLDTVRRETAWIDPGVQLWNRSLVENLEFGRVDGSSQSVGARVVDADLRRLIEQLPEGLQTPLGEGGALLSGGEGQRVRFGRALGRSAARLVILDEPFRGLEREKRATLLRRARDLWRRATLLCITHDITETTGFDRVIVIAQGRVVEDGAPADLAARGDSRYRSMLDAEAGLRVRLWADPSWRMIRLVDGKIVGDHGTLSEMVGTGGTGADDRPSHVRINV